MERNTEANQNARTTNAGAATTGKTTKVNESSGAQKTTDEDGATNVLNSLKPVAKVLLVAAAKVQGKDISQIAGVVWDEFQEMTPFQKMLAAIGTALVVGAAGYFSWKLVSGNWESIKNWGDQLSEALKDKAEEMAKNPDTYATLGSAFILFTQRQVDGKMPKSDVLAMLQELYKNGYGEVLDGLADEVKKRDKSKETK